MAIGIYKILCSTNGRFYIGQSRNLESRYNSHLYALRNNKHKNNHLQYAFNKYGESSFEYSIIETCPFENIDEREDFWIKKYGLPALFNKKTGGGNGFYFSQSTIELWKKIRTGKKQSEETIAKRVSKNIGKKRSEASKIKISNILKGRTQPAEQVEKMRKSKKGVKMKEEYRLKRIGQGSRPVSQYTLDGVFIRGFSSAKEAGETLSIIKGDITQVCRGNRKTRGGFVFKYTNN